ncbi:MAG: hypothetical protein ABIV26_06170 [Candidatus Limnocylindrales bacterium]
MRDRSNGAGATDEAHGDRPAVMAATAPHEPRPTRADRAGGAPGELVAGLSPTQIIGGFALVAGLLVLLRRRTRRGR